MARARQNPTTAQWWLIGGGVAIVGVGAYFLFRSPPAAASTPVAASAPAPQLDMTPAPQMPAPQDTLLTPQQAAEAAGAAMVAAEAAANSSLPAAPIIHVSASPLGHGINPTATVRVGDRFQVDPPYPATAGAMWMYSADATYLNDSGGGLYQAIKPGQVTISANLMQPDNSSLDGKYVIVTITP
jgi:hypothetical protein